MKEDTALQWGQLTNEQQKTHIQNKMMKFQTGDAPKVKQWTDIGVSILNALK